MSQSSACAISHPHSISSVDHAPFMVIEGGRSRRVQQQPRVNRSVHESDLIMVVVAVCFALVLGTVWCRVDASNKARIDELIGSCDQALITIMPGDTLWTIAEEYPVEGCRTSAIVRHIKTYNHLDDVSLRAGMQLYVPQESTDEQHASS